MTIERLDPSQIDALDDADVSRHIEHDWLIRQGLCPNNCGLMIPTFIGQECPHCHFTCNVRDESRPTQ